MVLARVSGVFALVPLPGLQSGPKLARIAVSVVITLVLAPFWPQPDHPDPTIGGMLLAILPEAGIGVALGLAVAFILEAFGLAAQILSLNAGFSFAQTIDPATQGESGVLVVLAQLASGLVFLALGLDHAVIGALAHSLRTHPSGHWLTPLAAEALLRLGAGMLSLAVRLAMPCVALLVLADVALALLGRLNAQLQLLTLAFPLKMSGTFILLGWLLWLLPKLTAAYAGEVFGTLRRVWGF